MSPATPNESTGAVVKCVCVKSLTETFAPASDELNSKMYVFIFGVAITLLELIPETPSKPIMIV